MRLLSARRYYQGQNRSSVERSIPCWMLPEPRSLSSLSQSARGAFLNHVSLHWDGRASGRVSLRVYRISFDSESSESTRNNRREPSGRPSYDMPCCVYQPRPFRLLSFGALLSQLSNRSSRLLALVLYCSTHSPSLLMCQVIRNANCSNLWDAWQSKKTSFAIHSR